MVKIIRMKNYTILLIVLILISCQYNKEKDIPSDRYVDSIQHIEYKIQKNHMGSILTVGDVQITFAPNGHIMGIKNKSLKDGHIRVYYLLDKRDKDEISHFYTIKNGLDGVAVFYHCENIINHVDFYKNNELVYSKKSYDER
ncbi:MAG: hypothetical protein HXO32_02780 [Prevotella sp.]|nr:hypothetical protein [Prevotella sp.]